MSELTGEAKHRELVARSQDEIRVRNPRIKDYYVKFDGRSFRVPGSKTDIGHGKGEGVYPRYIAEKFIKEFAIGEINSDAARFKGVLDKKHEGTDVFIPLKEEVGAPRTNNAESMKKYMSQCFVKIERRFGLDEVPDEFETPNKDPVDVNSVLLEEIEKEAMDNKEAFTNAIAEDED